MKAKLENLQTNQLFGALLEVAEKSTNEKTLENWANKGGKAFSQTKKTEGVPISISFPEKPSMELRKELRASGFKWNSLSNVWEGNADPKIAKDIANQNQGIVMEISA